MKHRKRWRPHRRRKLYQKVGAADGNAFCGPSDGFSRLDGSLHSMGDTGGILKAASLLFFHNPPHRVFGSPPAQVKMSLRIFPSSSK